MEEWVIIPEDIRERLGPEPSAPLVIVGVGDVVLLKALKAPKMADSRVLLTNPGAHAGAAGLTPEDIYPALREVRANK